MKKLTYILFLTALLSCLSSCYFITNRKSAHDDNEDIREYYRIPGTDITFMIWNDRVIFNRGHITNLVKLTRGMSPNGPNFSFNKGEVIVFIPKEDRGYICILDKGHVVKWIQEGIGDYVAVIPRHLDRPQWTADYYDIHFTKPNNVVLIVDNHKKDTLRPLMSSEIDTLSIDIQKGEFWQYWHNYIPKEFYSDSPGEFPNVQILPVKGNNERVLTIDNDSITLTPVVMKDAFSRTLHYPSFIMLKELPDIIFVDDSHEKFYNDGERFTIVYPSKAYFGEHFSNDSTPFLRIYCSYKGSVGLENDYLNRGRGVRKTE